MFSTFSPLFLTDWGTSGALLASGTTLSEGSSHDNGQFVSIFWITLVALISPVLSRLTGKKIPDVVFLLIFGMLIGPNVLHLAGTEGGIPLLKELGLGMLFLIAGFEINVSSLRSRQGYSAIATWFVCFALGMTGTAVITSFSHELNTYIAVGMALSSTALGTLLPMLKSHGAAGTPVGNAVLVHGAVGELLPVFAISLLLSSRSPGMAFVVLLAFMVVAVVTALIPHRLFAHVPGLRQIMAAEANTTGQTVLRLAMFLLATLIMCTALFDLDAVLGAFAAGLILRTLTPPAALHMMTRRLEVVGFTFMIPLFFVVSGMGIDVSAVVANPLGLLAVVVGILLCRGVPVLLAEHFFDTRSGLTTRAQKVQLALYSAAGLPIIVAVTEVATSSGLLEESTASLLVAGGALTVLLFPLWALGIRQAFGSAEPSAQAPSRKEQMNALKAQRNAQTKLATGMIPVVRLKSQSDAASDAGAGSDATGSDAGTASGTSSETSSDTSSEAAAEVKKGKGSAGGSAQK
ncbi:cation:proton antiporter [Rothia mucilaginosa]|uniref:cation:proton antiporter n=1 Tax=Rothia mucilaginosa TaxID=43675 RepID=UPI0028DBBCCC|nr:cation:proton antiporter [Rothia mucilaginosa]